MSPDDVPVRVSGRHVAVVGDGLLVLDAATGSLHTLSHSAGVVYASIDGLATTAEIVVSIAEDLGLDADSVVGDVTEAIDAMCSGALVSFDDSAVDTSAVDLLTDSPTDIDMAPLAPTVEANGRGLATDGWSGVGFVVAGAVALFVRSNSRAIADLLHEPLALLPASIESHADVTLSVAARPDGATYEVRRAGIPVDVVEGAHVAAGLVLAACNRIATTKPTQAVKIHGGVVSKDERAVVLCGESGAGKSTLTAALVQHGWQYLTDEVAVIEPTTSLVTPYPKWVDLSSTSLRMLGLDEHVGIGPTGAKHHVPPQALGDVGGAAPVAAIVMLTSGQPEEAPRRLGPAEAVEAMLGNVFATTWDHPNGLQALVDLCSTSTVVQMPRRPLDEMVALVDDLVRTARRPPG